MTTPVKLLIGVVSNRNPSYGFITSLDQMKNHIKTRGIGHGFNLTYLETKIQSSASLLSQGRQNILEAAVKGGFTHVLMLDDDMVFPPDTALRLFAATVSDPLKLPTGSYLASGIGVNATRRRDPKKIEYTATDLDGRDLISAGVTGVVPVSSCGLSVFLLNVSALCHFCKQGAVDAQPWFEVVWSPAHGMYLGEDRYFCKKLLENGLEIMVDQDLSQEIGHIGDFVYSYKNCS